MVVGHNQDTDQVINDTLETEGFDTITVSSIDTTLTVLKQANPDLVILDSKDVGESDFQDLRFIRRNSDVPVIMLTPRYKPEELQRAFSLGADDYVRKPFGTRSFVARIRAKLRRCRGGSGTSRLVPELR